MTYELRFQHLHDFGRAYCFPCDKDGHVELDALSDRAQDNYYFARRSIGLHVAEPVVKEVLKEQT